MSDGTIRKIWRQHGLQPHRVGRFKLSTDPHVVEKLRDVVGLYVNPPAKAVVFCVDEKSGIQALDRTCPVLPLRPGVPERQTHDYVRHGTTTLYAALRMLDGVVIGECRRRHRSQEFIQFLRRLERATPPDQALHLILDNLSAHKSPHVRRWLTRHPRVHFHFVPTSSSWLNFGGTLVRGDHPHAPPAWHLYQRAGARASDSRILDALQSATEAVRLDEGSRYHPREDPV